MASAPLGVLLVAGKLTHQENYCQQFRKDPRCQLIAVTDEKDISPERRYWNRALAIDLEIPYLPDLDKALAIIQPKITIPMHYKTEKSKITKILPVEEFTSRYPKEIVHYLEHSEIRLDRSMLPEHPQIYVLKYAN